MRIDFLSHTSIGGDFVVGSHHLSRALSARGHQVRHVGAPVSAAHLVRLGDPFVRARFVRFLRGGEVCDGVLDIVPFTPLPWTLARRTRALARVHSLAALAAPFTGLGALDLAGSDFLVVDEPRFAGLITQPRLRATLAYRATDLYGAMRGDDAVDAAEREICRRADVLFATSEAIAAHLRAVSGRAAHVIPNGVDFAHFATPAQQSAPIAGLPGERRHRAVYVGAFDARFCADSLSASARALPDHVFLLAGPGSARAAARVAAGNVIALGAVRYAQLPALLQACAVGLLPFSTAGANAGRSPMKLFEYAAAGLAVAATPAFRPGKTAPRSLCQSADFAAAVRGAFALAGDDDLLADARAAARAEDWDAKATELLRCMLGARTELALRVADDPALIAVGDSWN